MKVAGISGAVVIFEINADSAPQLIAATDIPLTGIKAKQRVDTIALKNWITQHAPQHAYIERGQAMPRQGSALWLQVWACDQRHRGGDRLHRRADDHRRAWLVEEVPRSARWRQGKWMTACASAFFRSAR